MVTHSLKRAVSNLETCVGLLLAMHLLMLQSCVRPVDECKQIDSKEGRFSFQMPGQPEDLKNKAATAAGPIDVVGYCLETDNGNQAFLACYFDFPESEVDVETLLDETKTGVVAAIKGKLLEDTKIKLQGNLGREFLAQLPGGIFYRCQMIIVGNRMYQVVVTQPSKTRSADIARFFKSVKLLETQK